MSREVSVWEWTKSAAIAPQKFPSWEALLFQLKCLLKCWEYEFADYHSCDVCLQHFSVAKTARMQVYGTHLKKLKPVINILKLIWHHVCTVCSCYVTYTVIELTYLTFILLVKNVPHIVALLVKLKKYTRLSSSTNRQI